MGRRRLRFKTELLIKLQMQLVLETDHLLPISRLRHRGSSSNDQYSKAALHVPVRLAIEQLAS